QLLVLERAVAAPDSRDGALAVIHAALRIARAVRGVAFNRVDVAAAHLDRESGVGGGARSPVEDEHVACLDLRTLGIADERFALLHVGQIGGEVVVDRGLTLVARRVGRPRDEYLAP